MDPHHTWASVTFPEFYDKNFKYDADPNYRTTSSDRIEIGWEGCVITAGTNCNIPDAIFFNGEKINPEIEEKVIIPIKKEIISDLESAAKQIVALRGLTRNNEFQDNMFYKKRWSGEKSYFWFYNYFIIIFLTIPPQREHLINCMIFPKYPC